MTTELHRRSDRIVDNGDGRDYDHVPFLPSLRGPSEEWTVERVVDMYNH